MKKIILQSLYPAGTVVCALLLVGASNPVQSIVTSTMTNSVASGATTSAISRPTGSIASKATCSVTSKTTTSLASGATGSAATGAVGGTTTAPVTLSAYAEELARIIKFDRQVLIMVKEITHEHIGRLIGFDESGYQIIAPGLAVPVPEDKTDQVLSQLRRKLIPLHYIPFVVEMNAGIKIDKIGILKGTDQYEILRVMHTDGDDFDITNQDVLDRLKEWEKNSPFDIIGADSDWVEIEFKSLPRDLKAFAEEVYEFCPDAVDQGPGSIEELVKEISKTKRLFLWWD